MNYKQLKIFAVCCMVFDHTVRIFPLEQMLAPLADALWRMGYDKAADWLLGGCTHYLMYIGRLAAPIFVYCIALGFAHTSNVRRYLGRILITAVIAQAPYIAFDLAEKRLYGIDGDWRETELNILFTLALGLCVLILHEELKRRRLILLSPVMVVLATWFAMELGMEGGQGYIILVFAYYVTRDWTRCQRAALFVPVMMLSRRGLVLWVVESIGTEQFARVLRTCLLNVLGAYFGMLVTLADNGEKGRAGKSFQYFMYAFYPAHFALLALLGFLRPPLT